MTPEKINAKEEQKKIYEKPELVEHGPVEKITEQIIQPQNGKIGAIVSPGV